MHAPRTGFLASALIAASALVASAQTPPPNLMPLPFHLVRAQGKLVVNRGFRVATASPASVRLRDGIERFLAQLSRQTGMPVETRPVDDRRVTLVVSSSAPGPAIDALNEDESYTLDVSPESAQLRAHTDVGALRGLETLLQLVSQDRTGFSIAAMRLEDHPRFSWRGLLLDVTSHWMPVDVVERNLDAMAAVKLNVFHWHLSDDQGFRVESKRFPKLHQLGSDGDYYTQDQIRHVIAYAHARGIRILPEFDMPGHCASWLVGYPELASAPGPYSVIHTFGVYDPVLDPTREEVYRFVDALLGEMTALFPDEYFHIGGDEVNGKQWHANSHIQEFIRLQHLKDEHGLQTYFNKRLEALVRKHGKKMVGWDEILHPDLPADIMIHSWRDQESLAAAAKQGHPAILSFGYYLDHLDHAGYHYGIDPQGGAAAHLSPSESARILGGEACMWTEFVSTETVDSRTWPKTAAIAERLWSQAEVNDLRSMYGRLQVISRRLDWSGVEHRSVYRNMLERLSGDAPTDRLKILVDVVEPLGIDVRERARRYSQSTAFNRLVDTARGESELIRNLEFEILDLAHSPGTPDWKHVEQVLRLWEENDEKLAPLLQDRALLLEAAPLSASLSEVGRIGLEALEYVKANRSPGERWAADRISLLELKEKPQAEVTLAAAKPVRMLVDLAAHQTTAKRRDKE